jgi:hypothetical protein
MDNITVVPLPDGAWWVGMNDPYTDRIIYTVGKKDCVSQLPPGQYDYLFTWPECSDKDCEKVVQVIHEDRFVNYCGDYPIWWHHAIFSFKSWLRSQGHNPESKFAILKKKV